ncbi:TIGR03560 family F420-dependent LLM class oxidoreductase [Kribbella sp. NBC_01510]|uniref:TIGR03560 family F420-dependent LLM class oxidoreductase n=1 Tax=Kribbella sp. NBC_01510 TaxID=2903581 RepID=UPI00386A7850
MKLGVHVVSFDVDVDGGAAAIGPTLARVGRAAEDAGVYNLSVMDHYLQLDMAGGAGRPMMEGYTTLGFLAAHTSTVELQLLVTGVTYRYPGLLAKIVSTLDVLSGGRALLGIGAAWYEREHAALGVPFPPLRERFERLEETLQIVHQMWSEDNGPYHGLHYRLAETINSPQPLRVPRPPIMIGGVGRRRPCGWSRSTPTPATCSPAARAPGRPRSARSSRSCKRTVRGLAPISAISASRSCGPVRWRSQPPAVRCSPRHSARTPKSASTRFT